METKDCLFCANSTAVLAVICLVIVLVSSADVVVYGVGAFGILLLMRAMAMYWSYFKNKAKKER